MFWRHVLPSCLGSKGKPSKKSAIMRQQTEQAMNRKPGMNRPEGNYERGNGRVAIVCKRAQREPVGVKEERKQK
jgi:hypothetical protein